MLPGRGVAQEASLDVVLSRVAEYVVTLQQKLASIVAEERYSQESRVTTGRRNEPARSIRRLLKSDLLLVRPPREERYVEFRDVFEVDGNQVRDREERLTRLFLQPTAATADQLKTIIDESARHNLGDIPRNINTPMLTLMFLQPDLQPRFRFKRAGGGTPALGSGAAMQGHDPSHFRVTTEMLVIEFREIDKPTVIKTDRGRDFPARGRFWVDPDSGAVRMSELTMLNDQIEATIVVSYQSEPLLGFQVPVAMRERYRAGGERVEGVATYGRFRQFQVSTGEVIGKPPGV